MDEEVLITHVASESRFLLRTMRKETLLAFKTTNQWSFEVVLGDPGITHLYQASGPDGRKVVGSWSRLIPIADLIDPTEIEAINTEISQALTSTFPL